MTKEFKEFNSIPRLSKDMIITEKLDWTNACVVITEDWEVFAQSRSRIVTIWDDNYWFAWRVEENKEELKKLWVGYHYWEWWWKWIQRKYWMDNNVFSLFVFRWEELPSCVSVVPRLYEWPFDTNKIEEIMAKLKEHWSYAKEWFMNPEWIVIFHTWSYQVYKKTFENDWGKWTKDK